MNRIDQLFQRKPNNILSIYFTAGFPYLESTTDTILQLTRSGADMLEIGIPFSDPLADGPVIQQSSQVAIRNGMNLHTLFAQLKDIRKHTDIPMVAMGYLNPVMQFGLEKFCQACQEVGIDGLILPDLPLFEYQHVQKPIFEKYGLHPIFLVTPQTPEKRIHDLDEASKGFMYVVSTFATTGQQTDVGAQSPYFDKLNGMGLKNPRLIGFGIRDKASFDTACTFANGAIIGSAFIRAVEHATHSDLGKIIDAFVKQIRN